jgi:hypothetical protein
MTKTLFAFIRDPKDKTMRDVIDVIGQEAQWLDLSRRELVTQLRRARRVAHTRFQGSRLQWRSLVSDLSTMVDRSVEPMFDAALAVAEFAHDLRVSCRRVWSRL